MVIASTLREHGQRILLLGLSDQNVTRLQAGEPIRLTRASHGLAIPADTTIFIVADRTEAAIEHGLRAAGLITDQTVIQGRPM